MIWVSEMASKSILEKMTYKSGKFIFSAKYSKKYLFRLLIEIEILFQTINDLPILPKIASQIQEKLIKKSIFGTAAIEGNPLSEEKVNELIENPQGNQTTGKAQKEINNLIIAYDYLQKIKAQDKPLLITEKLLRNIHKWITSDINYKDNVPGNYRNHIVKVGDDAHGGIYTPPKILKDIQLLMKNFLIWINHDDICALDPIIRAALAHYHIGLIHPFSDGNGRTSRIIEAMLLQASGIKYVPMMLSNYYYQNSDDYYWSFSKCINNKENDVTQFLKFVLVGLIQSLKEIKETITFHIRVLTLKDYFNFLQREKNITHRQYNLIMLLIDNTNYVFTINILNDISPYRLLYKNISPSTIRRDIKNLLNYKLIKQVNENSFGINMNVLS